MRLAIVAAVVALAIGGCRSSDPFCRSHNAADLTPSAEAYRAMSPAARRDAENRLQEAARRCGWEP